MDCPWGHSQKGRCSLPEGHGGDHVFTADTPTPAVSMRAAGALKRVVDMLDAAFKAYQDAREVAAEEGSSLPSSIDEQIVANLVQADCMIRTQATLRAVRDLKRPKLGLVPRTSAADGDRR